MERSKYAEIKQQEQNLLFHYIQKKGLDYSASQLLRDYFDKFTVDIYLQRQFEQHKINGLKDVERLLEVMIPVEDRKLNGAFFTPSYIVDFIIKEVAPEKDNRVVDLSCGCGAFLIGLLEYYKKKWNKSLRAVIRENIFGFDILPYNVERSKILLAIYALQEGEVINESEINIYQADSLRAKWPEQFDCVVGNPPYVKFQDLTDENRIFLSEDWRTLKNGTFNLYFAFFELGYRLLKQGGKLGYITPNNWFTSLSGEPLRQFFQQEKCVRRIIDFNHRKVFDVQTYTAITFLVKAGQDAIQYDRIGDNQQPESFLKLANGSMNQLSSLNPKKWRLLKTDEQETIQRIESSGAPIGQIFDICVGIATLKDEVYFIDSINEEGDYYLKEWSGQTFPIEKAVTRNVFKISDFKNQSEICKNTRRIIFPYRVKAKTAVVIPENEFSKSYPNCYTYFQAVKNTLAQRDKGKSEYKPFYAWGRTQGLTRHGRKLLIPTFSQYPRFLIVDDEEAFFTNGYGLYFRESNLFQHALGIVDRIDIVQKVLNSTIMHYYVSKTSVSIEGGYPCYQKNFIEKFTLPDFTEQEVAFLRMANDRAEIDNFLIRKYKINLAPYPFQNAPSI